MQLGVIDFSEKHADIGTLFWATVLLPSFLLMIHFMLCALSVSNVCTVPLSLKCACPPLKCEHHPLKCVRLKSALWHPYAFSSQIVELQKCYDMQSKELGAVRNELQANKSLVEEKDRTITTLTMKVAQAKHEDSTKAEQIATVCRDLEQLWLELSSASTQFTDIQERYAAQSQELNSVRDDFCQIEILHSGTSQGSGKPSKSAVAQQIARALEEKNNQMKELRADLAVATLRNSELQRSYEALLNEVSIVHDQLSMQGSQHEGTIISLTAQVEQWKRTDAMKAEQMASTLEVVQKLQQDISTSISQLAEL